MRYILLLVLASIACGQTAQLPIVDTPVVSIVPKAANYAPTAAPVPTPWNVVTLGKLNIRELPSTNSAVLGWYEADMSVTVIALVDGIGCPRWYLVIYQAERGFICASWTK